MVGKVIPKKKISKQSEKKTEPAKTKYSELVNIPSGTNSNLTSPTNDFMRELMGEPRTKKDYAKEDNGLDNKELEKLHKIDSVGPFRVTGLALAVDSLKCVMADIKKEYPEIYATLGTAGMRSVRLQRSKKATKKISNHAWGVAIDLKIDGILDPWRDDKTQRGLATITPLFNKHGWYWGGAYKPGRDDKGKIFSKEDAMHFEICVEVLLGWAKLGYLGSKAQDYALKHATNGVQKAKSPAKVAQIHTAEVLFKQTKPVNNPLAPEQLPQSNHFTSLLKQRPNETFPSWYGKNGWVTKVRSGFSWFRK